MNARVEACDECAQKCLIVHKEKKNPSPPVASFFKVMVGDGFSEALFIPPLFAGKVKFLIGKETYLEDSTGRKWTVTLSNVDGHLAFQEGWRAFLLDHKIQLGDFLVFHYIMGHFVVQIFGKHGCQKLRHSIGGCVQNKRAKFCEDLVTANGHHDLLEKELVSNGCVQNKSTKACSDLVTANGHHNPLGKDSLSNWLADGSHPLGSRKPRSPLHAEQPLVVVDNDSNNCDNINAKSQIVCAADYSDEPYLMLNRDISFMGQDNRISAFDLSDFEMSNRRSTAVQAVFDREGSECPSTADPVVKVQTESGLVRADPIIVKHEDASQNISDGEKYVVDDDMMDVLMNDGNSGSRTMPSLDSQFNNYAVDKVLFKIEKKSCKKTQSSKDLALTPSTGALKHKKHVGVSSACTRKAQVAERTRSHSKIVESSILRKGYAPTTNNGQQEQEEAQRLSESSKSPLTTGPSLNVIKGGPLKSPAPGTDSIEPQKMVKEELVDGVDWPAPLSVEVPCLVTTESESFLELPRGLPSFLTRGRPRQEPKEQVVILKDPMMRLWPVFYHEKSGFKVLTDGWPAFRKGNGIQSGDTCCFAPQNESNGIYIVRIIRHQDGV